MYLMCPFWKIAKSAISLHPSPLHKSQSTPPYHVSLHICRVLRFFQVLTGKVLRFALISFPISVNCLNALFQGKVHHHHHHHQHDPPLGFTAGFQ